MNLIWITNITDYCDHPEVDSLAHILEIYGVKVMPGEAVQIDSDLINQQIRSLVESKYIVIGDWPSYYRDFRFPPQKTQAQFIEEDEEIKRVEGLKGTLKTLDNYKIKEVSKKKDN